MGLHPLDFTQEELELKLGDKKMYVAELFAQYAIGRDTETRNKLDEILFPIFDEIVTERINNLFDNFASIDDTMWEEKNA